MKRSIIVLFCLTLLTLAGSAQSQQQQKQQDPSGVQKAANPKLVALSPEEAKSIGKVSDIVVELRNPRLTKDELTYDVRVLEGAIQAQGGACSLFIDIIGRPLTPLSVAGARRRCWRRARY